MPHVRNMVKVVGDKHYGLYRDSQDTESDTGDESKLELQELKRTTWQGLIWDHMIVKNWQVTAQLLKNIAILWCNRKGYKNTILAQLAVKVNMVIKTRDEPVHTVHQLQSGSPRTPS